MHSKIYSFLIGLAVFIFLVNGSCVFGNDMMPESLTETTGGNVTVDMGESFITLEVPLFSPHFSETPVALVNDEPIILSELAETIKSSDKIADENEKLALANANEYQEIVNRLIDIRLIIQEARNIGLDESSAFQDELKDFEEFFLRQELIRRAVAGTEPDSDKVDELYKLMSREVKLHTFIFHSSKDAEQLLAESKEGDFEKLAKDFISQGKAREEIGKDYIKIKDLLPKIGEAAYYMEVGSVSPIFRSPEGFYLFQMTDRRFVEDPTVKAEAVKKVRERKVREKAREYSESLIDEYVTIDESLYNQLNFDTDFDEKLKDQRVLATINSDDQQTITVADLAKKLKQFLFHDTTASAEAKLIDKKKLVVFTNMLFERVGVLEARRLGLDKSQNFIRETEEFERSKLFGAFMTRIVAPEIQIKDEEMRTYYEKHLENYSTPTIFRFKSLAFTQKQDAENALDKLRNGADFGWISANASNLVHPGTEDLLSFDKQLLSLTALPDDLQEAATGLNKGDSLLFTAHVAGGEYYYVLLVQDLFPPEPKPFEEVRAEIKEHIFKEELEKAVEDWSSKLKEVYDTQIFLLQR